MGKPPADRDVQSFDFIGASVEIALFDSAEKWFITEFRGLASKGCVNVQWQDRVIEVRTPQVRVACKPKLGDTKEDQPLSAKVNDRLEVKMPASPSKPASCISASVRSICGPYFLVSLEGRGRQEDLLVLPDQLRAPGRTEALSSMALEEVVLDCPEGTEEAHPDTETEGLKQEWLMTLQRECNLLGLGVRRGESGRRQLKLVGERSATTRASKLLHTVHFWNQAEIVKCRAQQADLEKRLSCLEGASREEGKVIEFPVAMDIMQLIIGRSGKRLQDIKDQLCVGIEVLKCPQDRNQAIVRVVGQDPDAVAATQRQLEYKRRKLSFDVDEVGYILGRNLANIREIAEKAGLLSMRWDPTTSKDLEMVGLADHLDSAEMLIQAHLDYRQVYNEMREEQGALTQSFQALDYEMSARRNRSRGPPSRQTRARTPPPTARMLAMGRVHKPFRREEEMRGKGKGNRMPLQPPGGPGGPAIPPISRKGQSVKGFSKGSKSRSPEPSESEESQDDDDDDDELVADRPPEDLTAASRADDHEPEGGQAEEGVVPDFIFADRKSVV